MEIRGEKEHVAFNFFFCPIEQNRAADGGQFAQLRSQHVHPWKRSLYPYCLFFPHCFHLTFGSIQPRVLIKGRAALPHSQRACLIFHPLSRIKKEGTYKLEHV